jgi:hypothetical protein
MHTQFLSENLQVRYHFGGLGVGGNIGFGLDLSGSGLSKVRTEPLGISSLTERLSASKETLFSIAL